MKLRTAVIVPCLIVMAFAVLGLPAAGTVLASSARAGCVVGGYSTTASKCVTVPPSGSFSIKVPHTKAMLVGKGSPATAGTKIHVVAVANPTASAGTAIRVTANGPVPPLHAKPGKLFRYDPRSGKLSAVKSLTKPGIYLVER